MTRSSLSTTGQTDATAQSAATTPPADQNRVEIPTTRT